MEQNKPVVSVIMPAYNAQPFIEEAIRSVMTQTFSDWELLVLDDGSSDETAAIAARLAAEDPRILFLPNEKNMGVARTRNRGFELCQGAYIALLDSDDVWHQEKLEKQLALARETGAELIYSSYRIVNSKSEKVKADYIVSNQLDLRLLLRENIIGCSTVLLSRRVVQEYRFEVDFYHEDYVLWLRLLQDGCKAAGCVETLVDWRYLENSRSFDKRRSACNRWKIYREYLKLPVWKSAWFFAGYAMRGVRKYMRK